MRSVFAQMMALVLAQPGQYHKAVQASNLAHPDNPFMSMSWTMVLFSVPVFSDESAMTIVEVAILQVLLHNQIPVK